MNKLPNLNQILKCMPKKLEDRMLPAMPHIPVVVPDKVLLPVKYPKRNIEMMGPERIHNQLIYQQYGIIALGGGALKGEHFDVISNRINKYTDFERFFAVWRLNPPWKPKSKKSLNKKMGGGKSKVHHYETPVRAGRVLVEMGGIGDFAEIEHILETVCKKMPIYCRPITQQIMDELKEEKQNIDANNFNPFDYRELVRDDYSNSRHRLKPHDMLWGGGTYYT